MRLICVRDEVKGTPTFKQGLHFQLSGYQNRLSTRAALIALTLVDLLIVCGGKEGVQGAVICPVICVRI